MDISGTTDEVALEGISVKLHGSLDCSGTELASSTVNRGSYSFEDVTLASEGTYSFFLQFGSGICHATHLSYTYDSTAPTSPAIVLNGGATATQFSQLSLVLNVTEANAIGLQMCIAQNSSCSGCSYEAYSTSGSLTLSDVSAGAKSVSVKFRDAAGNESSCATDSIALSALSVVPQYANAAKWNSYVRSSNGSTACDGSETGYVDQVCIHGGERRKVVTAESSCTGLSMSDSQGVFDWSCSVVGGFAQFTSTLKQESRLADLIQGGATPAWRALTVTLTKGTQSAQSVSSVWWSNSVEVPATNSGASDAVVTLSAADTVYYIPSSRLSAGYHLSGSGSSLVVAEGAALKWVDGNTVATKRLVYVQTWGATPFHWIEGEYDCGDSGTASERAEFGVVLESAKFTQIRNAAFQDCTNTGVNGNTWGTSHHYINVSALRNGTGVYYLAGDYISGKNLIVSQNSGNGFFPWASNRVSFDGITADQNGGSGISGGNWSDTSLDSTFTQLDLTRNGGHGMYFACAATGSLTVSHVKSYGNGKGGSAASGIVLLSGGGTIRLSDVRSHANGATGVQLWGPSVIDDISVTNNDLTGLEVRSQVFGTRILAASNGQAGVWSDATGAILSGVTSVNNGGGINAHFWSQAGFHLGGNENLIHNVLGANNATGGALVAGHRTTVSQLASAHNQVYGIGTSNFVQDLLLRGNLLVGNHPTNTHCAAGGWPNNLGFSSTACVSNANSASATAGLYTVATTALSLSSAFNANGKATSGDSVNLSDDSSGASTYGAITDWFNFEHPHRTWGALGSSGGTLFPHSSLIAPCTGPSGTDCAIQDFALDSPDTSLLGRSGDGVSLNQAFVAGSACPSQVDGNQVISTAPYCRTTPTAWTDDSVLVPSVTNQTDCVNGVDGTPSTADDRVWVAIPSRTYLKNAIELMLDGAGDDDGLCESSEACLYTPNFGAYQGHGTLGTCTFSNGTITGVSMYGYSANGR